MKDKIIFLLGKNWKWFRKWYWKKAGGKYYWGIMDFLNDNNPPKQINWAEKIDLDEFLRSN